MPAAFVAFAATMVIPAVLSSDGENQKQLILNNPSGQLWLGICAPILHTVAAPVVGPDQVYYSC